MTLQTEIATLEGDLRDAGVSLDIVLSAASVDRSTWTRWKNGSVKGARYDTIVRVKAAAADALSAAPPKADGASERPQADAA